MAKNKKRNFRPRVYVAGAISAENHLQFLSNIKKGIEAASKLAAAGYAPYCSFLDYQYSFFQSLFIEDYQEAAIAFLPVCDAVLVLSGFEKSKGTQAEIKLAVELGIPIVSKIELLKEVL